MRLAQTEELSPMKQLIALALGLIAFAPAAEAQRRVTISSKATYNDALVCYQHYAIARELARKLERHPDLTADQAAGFELGAILARDVLGSWRIYLGKAAGKRPQAEISTDVKRVGTPIIADANASLGGDRAATKRGMARSEKCSAFEIVETAKAN
jgi:hypothetical protein